MKILEAHDQYRVIQLANGNYRQYVALNTMMRWQVMPSWEIAEDAPPLLARVNYSNWAVDCDTCRESVVIDFGEPYFCPNCLNVRYGGRARRVVFPSPQDRAEIERILILRAVPETRNWIPESETLEDLRAQNIEHGEKA